jgi:hypothetical protein
MAVSSRVPRFVARRLTSQQDRLHGRIAGRFARAEPRARIRWQAAGLERKNGWTMAEQAGEAGPEGMHVSLT